MPHTLITGITGSGKTTLAIRLAGVYKARHIAVLVLDPFISALWQADFITNEPEQFLDVVFQSKNCAVFVDESGEMIGRWGGVMSKLATVSRNYGHNVHFICQRSKQLDINVRTQCENIFLFKQSFYDTKDLVNEFVADSLALAHTLKKGEFLCKVGIDGEVVKGKIF